MKDSEIVSQVRQHLPSLLLLCHDELGFELNFGNEKNNDNVAAPNQATKVVYAVYTASVPELSINPLVDKLQDYLHAKTTKNAKTRKQTSHTITLTPDITVQLCEISEFLSQLARGAPRAVNLIMGDHIKQPMMYVADSWTSLWNPILSQGYSFKSTGFYRSCAGQAYGMSQRMKAQSSSTDDVTMKLAWNYACKLLDTGSEADHIWDKIEEIEMFDFKKLGTVATTCSDAATAIWKADEKQRKRNKSVSPKSGFKCVDASVEALVDTWFNDLRDSACADFATSDTDDDASYTPITNNDNCHNVHELEEALRAIDSPVAANEVAMMLRCGSFMYNMHTDESDEDYYIVFVSPTRNLLDTVVPRNSFEKHVSAPMGSDKSGEVEYFGREYGSFIVELCKGNPKNLELLYCDPNRSVYENEDFAVLRQHRDKFVTKNSIRQYFGFISERLHRAKKIVEAQPDDQPLDSAAEDTLSKLLYHAFHKLFDLQHVVNYCEPVIWYGEETENYQFIMGIRKTRPLIRDTAREHIAKAEAMLTKCKETHAVVSESRAQQGLPTHPENVTVDTVRQLLYRARRKHLSIAEPDIPRTISGGSISLLSSDDVVRARLVLMEKEEGIKVVYASECSSRMLGTSHAGSDHDVVALFVYPSSRYFSLRTVATSIRKTYEATQDKNAYMAEVDITAYECQHAFKMLSDSNLNVFDAFMSPIVYATIPSPPEWTQRVKNLIATEYDITTLAMASWRHAKGNYAGAIEKQAREDVKLKKYIHVSRRLLFTMWLVHHSSGGNVWPPPLNVKDLLCTIPGEIVVTDFPRLEVPQDVRDRLMEMLKEENLPLLAHNGAYEPLLDNWIKATIVALKPYVVGNVGKKSRKNSTTVANWDEVLTKLSQTAAAALQYEMDRAITDAIPIEMKQPKTVKE